MIVKTTLKKLSFRWARGNLTILQLFIVSLPLMRADLNLMPKSEGTIVGWNNIFYILLILQAFQYFVYNLKNGVIRLGKIQIASLFFSVFLILSGLLAIDTKAFWDIMNPILRGIALIWAIPLIIRDKTDLEKISNAFICAALLAAGLSFTQQYLFMNFVGEETILGLQYAKLYVDSSASFVRSTGYFDDPNILGLILLIGSVLTYENIFRKDKLCLTIFWMIILLILIFALVLTFSRSNLIVLAATCLYISIKEFNKSNSIYFLIIMFFLFALFSAMGFFMFSMRESLGEDLEFGRGLLLLEGLKLGIMYPFSGVGAGNINFYTSTGLTVHNIFVEVFASSGLFALVAFSWILLLAWKSSEKQKGQHYILFATLIAGLFFPYLFLTVFWLVIAVSSSS